MKAHRIGIIMNGVTGRMGTNQHLMRSIVEIIRQGGVRLSGKESVMPDPILVGRNEEKLKILAETSGVQKWSTDLDMVMQDPAYQVYFDAQTTGRRVAAVKRAAKAGKHIYCEKPVATSTREALELVKACEDAGVKHGAVQDKLWLPGLVKLKRLIDEDFFGRILSVRGEFGYWVFEGHTVKAQRPSWNYRKADDGGIIMDMLC
ncbi:MAG: Gfo/Idh/MocA family oxidoreductase, partial [Bacteroidales bacterium]|nr:Gfo/Idh/MocA family oxidoreductase [Bacteroidales bacterium]